MAREAMILEDWLDALAEVLLDLVVRQETCGEQCQEGKEEGRTRTHNTRQTDRVSTRMNATARPRIYPCAQ
jgi:hypothetical protein